MTTEAVLKHLDLALWAMFAAAILTWIFCEIVDKNNPWNKK